MESPLLARLVLGSSSQWRKGVLEELLGCGVWKQMSPDIDEKAIRDPDAEKLCLMVAEAKADALADRARALCRAEGAGAAMVLLTADQVIRHRGIIREKPETSEENCAYLRSYAPDAAAECCSALVVTHYPSEVRVHGVDVCNIFFNPIPEDVVRKVVAKGETMTCAGGFAVEDPDLRPYIIGLDDLDCTSVQGLPVGLLRELVAKVEATQSKGNESDQK
ncbi:hypothetical protein DIPPA_06933 [Diplonema papillatum]|nr:hypothetical protein DIPPA_06933 [Diplonema papillatum]